MVIRLRLLSFDFSVEFSEDVLFVDEDAESSFLVTTDSGSASVNDGYERNYAVNCGTCTVLFADVPVARVFEERQVPNDELVRVVGDQLQST